MVATGGGSIFPLSVSAYELPVIGLAHRLEAFQHASPFRKVPMSRIRTGGLIARPSSKSCPPSSPLRLRVRDSIRWPIFLPLHVFSLLVVVVVITGDPSEVFEILNGFDHFLPDIEFDESCLVLFSSHVALVLSDRPHL
jgi:hypothetical protein